jgi:hypothetical protein
VETVSIRIATPALSGEKERKQMSWKAWLQGLAAAAIGGAATGAAQATASGTVGKPTAAVAGIGAIATVLGYLIKSPIQAGGAQVQVVITPKEEPKPEAK